MPEPETQIVLWRPPAAAGMTPPPLTARFDPVVVKAIAVTMKLLFPGESGLRYSD